MESDGGMDTILKAFPVISIHALLWRATIEYLQGKIKAEISIHALLWRATKTQGSGCQEPGRFQSTLSYGERRPEQFLCRQLHSDFNPRSPMESDKA